MIQKLKLKETLCLVIAEWLEIGHAPLYKYQEKFQEAIWSQGTISWRQIFNGKQSWHWLEHQRNIIQQRDEFEWIIFGEHQY